MLISPYRVGVTFPAEEEAPLGRRKCLHLSASVYHSKLINHGNFRAEEFSQWKEQYQTKVNMICIKVRYWEELNFLKLLSEAHVGQNLETRSVFYYNLFIKAKCGNLIRSKVEAVSRLSAFYREVDCLMIMVNAVFARGHNHARRH